jgi:arylsulfatase A-like enzyme
MMVASASEGGVAMGTSPPADGAAVSGPSRRRPNVVLINCDDLGYGDLGCYGSTANRTPVLDALAAGGIRFTDFYMASPVCSPSRGAMLTGSYPRRIGFGSFDGHAVLFPGMGLGLNPAERTIASLLREQGYATMLVGKWHCGDQPGFLPTDHGFDRYFGLPYSNDMGRQVGADEHPPLPLMLDGQVLQEQPDQAGLTERYTDECVRFIREHRAEQFFLYLAHMYVHRPIYPPARFLRESPNGRYGAAVACIDWSTGTIVHELEALGLLQDTLIVFTSDNGSLGHDGGSNGSLRGAKGSTYEGGQRVPCIMHWPNAIAPGQVSPQITTSLDFLPTFLGLAGAEVPDGLVVDGLDITPLFTGQAAPEEVPRTFAYYHHDSLEAVRAGDWKLHLRKGDQPVEELYDLVADPAEMQNLLAERPDVVAELSRIADAYRADLGDLAMNMEGAGCRPIGRVENPTPLTHYDPTHPYIEAMYDLPDRG